MKIKELFLNMAKGAAIGLAVIIPGVSGGTLAVLLGIYDKIIESIGGLFKQFRRSILFLLPIAIGAILAFAALYFPLKYALDYVPFPTMLLFAGLMLGGVPDLVRTARGNGFKLYDVTGIFLACALVVGICFIPSIGDVDLSADMPVGGYFLLILMGMLSSCALVVPGVSGSMLMLIFGYYQPLLDTVSALTSSFGHALAVLALFAVGLVIGFFTIAKLMQLLLNKFRRTTFWTIVGFVIGSIPAIIITFFNRFGDNLKVYLSPWQIAVGVILFIAGALATFFLTRLVLAKPNAKESADDCAGQAEEDPEKQAENTAEN